MVFSPPRFHSENKSGDDGRGASCGLRVVVCLLAKQAGILTDFQAKVKKKISHRFRRFHGFFNRRLRRLLRINTDLPSEMLAAR